jgi:hypothetical protein
MPPGYDNEPFSAQDGHRTPDGVPAQPVLLLQGPLRGKGLPGRETSADNLAPEQVGQPGVDGAPPGWELITR